jgi:uracil-DNA glycosylase
MQFNLFNGTQNKVLDAPTYAHFKQSLIDSKCEKCALSKGRHNIVVDRGNPDTSVLMIGEGPGENEDLQGKAFVGRAGRLLDQLLLESGFDTNQDSLIANVVKCRPPENRAPKQEEVDECISFLKKQVELVSPKIVLLLGATALKHFIKEKSTIPMRDRVGQFFEHADFPGIQFMVLFHPAYILRDPRKKPLMLEHLARFVIAWKALDGAP